MKCRGLLVFTLAFILVLSFAIAQEGDGIEDSCGDGIIDEGETCASCPADVICQDGEICDFETEECTSEDANETEEPEPVVEAADEEPEAAEETIEEPGPCGNGIIDAGETCASCPADVRCQSGERCDIKTEQCIKESDFILYIILGFLAVAIGGFMVIRTLRKKKPEEEPKPMPAVQPTQPLSQTGSIQATAEQKKAVPGEPVQAPAAEPAKAAPATQPVQETTQPPKAEPVQPPKQEEVQAPPVTEEVQAPPGMDEPMAPAKGESEIQDFIRMMRSKGHKDEEIREKLRQKGWPDTKIAVEFLTMKKTK